MKTEAKVGIFVFLGLCMLFLLSTRVNTLNSIGSEGYEVDAILDSAAGLEEFSKVKMRGVEAGYVKSLTLERGRVVARMFIYEGVSVPTDSMIVLAQENMLGGRYVEIQPGHAAQTISEQGTIDRQEQRAQLDETTQAIKEAADEFRMFITEAREIITPDTRDDLKQTFANLREVTDSLKVVISENRDNISSSIGELKEMAKSLRSAGEKFGAMSDKFGVSADSINAKLPQIVNRLDTLIANADTILEENRQPLKNTVQNANEFFDEGKNAVQSVDSFFNEGKAVVQKLDAYLEEVRQSEIEVSMHVESLLDDSLTKSYFSVSYRPNPTKYYMLSVSGAEDYSLYDEAGDFREPTRRDDIKYRISAQFGKRYDDLLLRAGMIESSGGVGMDYFLLNDQVRAGLELYDFDGRNDIRGDNPHAKAYFRYSFLKHIDTYIGVDNFLNDDATNFFIGAGVRFVDDDLKTLVGTVSGAGGFLK